MRLDRGDLDRLAPQGGKVVSVICACAKHNVTLGELALTGDLPARRAFVEEMARTWRGGEVAFVCVGLPD